MEFIVDERARNRAKSPHELFVINLIAFHLLLTPASIALGIGEWALLLPPLFSGLVMLFIFVRARKAEKADPWFVMAHWKYALRRCRLLIYAYLGSAVLVLLGWLISISGSGPASIMLTAFTRIAVMPTFIMVLVTFALSTSAIGQAARGEVPNGIVERYPAPAGMTPVVEKGDGEAGGQMPAE